jgi:hypothetical protein
MGAMALPLAVLLPFLDSGASDPVPAENDVVAGGTAMLVFGFLILAVVVLAFSFRKQLRKAQAARDEGVYGDEPAPDTDATSSPEPGGAAPR